MADGPVKEPLPVALCPSQLDRSTLEEGSSTGPGIRFTGRPPPTVAPGVESRSPDRPRFADEMGACQNGYRAVVLRMVWILSDSSGDHREPVGEQLVDEQRSAVKDVQFRPVVGMESPGALVTGLDDCEGATHVT